MCKEFPLEKKSSLLLSEVKDFNIILNNMANKHFDACLHRYPEENKYKILITLQ